MGRGGCFKKEKKSHSWRCESNFLFNLLLLLAGGRTRGEISINYALFPISRMSVESLDAGEGGGEGRKKGRGRRKMRALQDQGKKGVGWGVSSFMSSRIKNFFFKKKSFFND